LKFAEAKKMILSFSALILFTLPASAVEYIFSGEIIGQQLNIVLQEKQSSNNACDLYLQKFEYFQDLKVIDIQVSEVSICPLDVVGQRKAVLTWNFPINFRSQNAVTLRVNGQVRGIIGLQGTQVKMNEGEVK